MIPYEIDHLEAVGVVGEDSCEGEIEPLVIAEPIGVILHEKMVLTGRRERLIGTQ